MAVQQEKKGLLFCFERESLWRQGQVALQWEVTKIARNGTSKGGRQTSGEWFGTGRSSQTQREIKAVTQTDVQETSENRKWTVRSDM